jgi:hypothetical protein
VSDIASLRKGKIIVFGILFWYPLAGVTYQFLHYLLGLRRLGYDVYYVEDSARYIYDPALNDMSPNADANVAAIAPVLNAHGLEGRWVFRGNYPGGRCYGMSEDQLLSLYKQADAFLNVTGAQELREEHLSIPRRIYVESDPFGSQAKVANGNTALTEQLWAHDSHFSFGENIGAGDCDVPPTPFNWQPTRQPVVMDLWSHALPPGASYNTITTWHNKGNNITYRGDTYYWTKDREFEKVIDLPTRRPQACFELASSVGPDVQQFLRDHNWKQVEAVALSQNVDRYRSYIQNARAEFTVARDQYVRPNTGWFSDRSACYLAAGRPVITQETGFSKFISSGNGLFGWRTMDDVLAAVDAIESDPTGQCRAAREVAAEYFAAEKVLASLMERAGLA